MEKVLECSSRGDKRFSALFAQVEVYGIIDTIENHYQLAKRFPWVPKTWREAKGKKPLYIEIGGQQFPVQYLSQWYACLWLKYLDQHPELVKYARQFDSYHDAFARPGKNSQAEMIRLYVKEGRNAMLSYTAELRALLMQKNQFLPS